MKYDILQRRLREAKIEGMSSVLRGCSQDIDLLFPLAAREAQKEAQSLEQEGEALRLKLRRVHESNLRMARNLKRLQGRQRGVGGGFSTMERHFGEEQEEWFQERAHMYQHLQYLEELARVDPVSRKDSRSMSSCDTDAMYRVQRRRRRLKSTES